MISEQYSQPYASFTRARTANILIYQSNDVHTRSNSRTWLCMYWFGLYGNYSLHKKEQGQIRISPERDACMHAGRMKGKISRGYWFTCSIRRTARAAPPNLAVSIIMLRFLKAVSPQFGHGVWIFFFFFFFFFFFLEFSSRVCRDACSIWLHFALRPMVVTVLAAIRTFDNSAL